jgi:rhamnulokinase
MSSASTTQLFNPHASSWSETMLKLLGVRPELLPTLVEPGTDLGPLRPELARETGLPDVRVVASCSNQLAAELAGLPIAADENWAFLRLGPTSIMGTQLQEPRTNGATLELQFSNHLGCQGTSCLHKSVPGISLFHECQQFWEKADRV